MARRAVDVQDRTQSIGHMLRKSLDRVLNWSLGWRISTSSRLLLSDLSNGPRGSYFVEFESIPMTISVLDE